MKNGDPDNLTLKVNQALKPVYVPGLAARIVVGPAGHNLETLRRAGQQLEDGNSVGRMNGRLQLSFSGAD